MNLSVCIPTFNRHSLLVQRCEELLPWLSENVGLLIVDNASTPSVAEALSPQMLACPWIRILRNPFNIGGDANILRCVELAESEWVWLLGDDDALDIGAVATVVSMLDQAPAEVSAIKTSSPIFRHEHTEILDIQGFCKRHPGNLAFVSNALLISSWVFRRSALTSMESSYKAAGSMAGQLVLALSLLAEGGRLMLSPTQPLHALGGAEWSHFELEACLPTAIRALPMLDSAQSRAVGVLLGAHLHLKPHFLFYSAARCAHQSSRLRALWLYSQAICGRLLLSRRLVRWGQDMVFLGFFLLGGDRFCERIYKAR